MAANFDSYLDVDVEAIERPTPPPIGHWLATIKSHKTAERDYDKANGGPKTPVVELMLALNAPYDDAVEWAEANGADVNVHIGKAFPKDYRLNDEGGPFQLRQIGEVACELPVTGLKLRDLLEHLHGQQVKVYMDHRAGKEGSPQEGQFFPNITKVLSAKE